MLHYGDAVRTVPLQWKGHLFLVALRRGHAIDYAKLADSLDVEAGDIEPADASVVRETLGFQEGFETLVTDEPVARFIDVRVTWMRSATIATGRADLVVAVSPAKLLALTEAAVGDFAAEPVPLDEPGRLPSGLLDHEGTEGVLREVSEMVRFPLWVPEETLIAGKRFQLKGADWSAGLTSPASVVDRATLRFWLQPGGFTLFLDESPNPDHHERAREAWPNLIEAGLDRPWMTTLHYVQRVDVGISLVASEDFHVSARAVARDYADEGFPQSLEAVADSLVRFETA